MTKSLRIGSGAGFAGDRLDAALVLAERGELDFLTLECLAERTIALAQLRRRNDPATGYDPRLERRIIDLLLVLKPRGFRIVSNMGAANPLAAGEAIVAIAKRLAVAVKVAVVTGDDVLALIDPDERALEDGLPLAEHGPLVSANAYLGADAIVPALATGADIVITGRVADPSLFVAPIATHHGWSLDDHDRVARGIAVGHLLECAGQLCGGYFADPGRKDVPDMAHLGFPFADVDADGRAMLAKVNGTGGAITLATVKEQLLYEVTDPHAYVTPDVVADFSTITLEATGRDRVAVTDARGHARPGRLKVSVGYLAGFVGEGEIGYAGRNAMAAAVRDPPARCRARADGGRSPHRRRGSRSVVHERSGGRRRRAAQRPGAGGYRVDADRPRPCQERHHDERMGEPCRSSMTSRTVVPATRATRRRCL